MNLKKDEAQSLVAEILGMLHDEELRDVSVILCPPFPYLSMLVQQTSAEKRISIAAQNCSDKTQGAYTGEVSAAMLRSCGVTHVLIGHSERRSHYLETDRILAEKIKIALAENLTVICCCGETQAERESASHFETVGKQLESIFSSIPSDQLSKCIIAYEPVWAIGTGLTASPEQAQEMHHFIRQQIAKKYNEEQADKVSILYGGSCNEQNAKELFGLADVDGGLIGGASLKSRSFVNIIKSV